MGSLKVSNLFNLSVARETLYRASESVNGLVLFDASRGEKTPSRKDRLVLSAPTTLTEEIVVGRVELVSTFSSISHMVCSAFQSLPSLQVEQLLARIASVAVLRHVSVALLLALDQLVREAARMG